MVTGRLSCSASGRQEMWLASRSYPSLSTSKKAQENLKLQASPSPHVWLVLFLENIRKTLILLKIWNFLHSIRMFIIYYKLMGNVYNHPPPPPPTHPHRSWRQDPSTDSYVLVATSVSHPSADLLAGIRATELFTSYLIEPLHSETCKLTYICRVDLR